MLLRFQIIPPKKKKKKIELKSVVNVLLVVKPKEPDETPLRCVISEVFH